MKNTPRFFAKVILISMCIGCLCIMSLFGSSKTLEVLGTALLAICFLVFALVSCCLWIYATKDLRWAYKVLGGGMAVVNIGTCYGLASVTAHILGVKRIFLDMNPFFATSLSLGCLMVTIFSSLYLFDFLERKEQSELKTG